MNSSDDSAFSLNALIEQIENLMRLDEKSDEIQIPDVSVRFSEMTYDYIAKHPKGVTTPGLKVIRHPMPQYDPVPNPPVLYINHEFRNQIVGINNDVLICGDDLALDMERLVNFTRYLASIGIY